MRDHEEFVDDPPNSYENVLKEVTSKFEPNPGEIPELLFKFITLLGKEDDEWGGVKAMRVCVKEFLSWKSKFQKPNDNVATCKDFESFLFSLDLNAIKGSEIHGVVDPQANQETLKEPDRPSSSKAVLPKSPNTKEPDRPSSSKSVILHLPKAQNIVKESDCPSSSKTVSHLPKTPNILKGTDNPSTNKAVNPATDKKTLKVKIYMGTGWETDFPNLRRGSSPSSDLFVNLTIHGGKIQKTFHKSSWEPSWGEEFMFPLSNLENDELVVKVCDHNDKFVGTVRRLVSKLKQGIHVIPLSCELGKPYNTARLLMRFTFG